jgi:hypothetical protein
MADDNFIAKMTLRLMQVLLIIELIVLVLMIIE